MDALLGLAMDRAANQDGAHLCFHAGAQVLESRMPRVYKPPARCGTVAVATSDPTGPLKAQRWHVSLSSPSPSSVSASAALKVSPPRIGS